MKRRDHKLTMKLPNVLAPATLGKAADFIARIVVCAVCAETVLDLVIEFVSFDPFEEANGFGYMFAALDVTGAALMFGPRRFQWTAPALLLLAIFALFGQAIEFPTSTSPAYVGIAFVGAMSWFSFRSVARFLVFEGA